MHPTIVLGLALVVARTNSAATPSENDGHCTVEWNGFINCKNFRRLDDLVEGINRSLAEHNDTLEFLKTNKTLLLIEGSKLEKLTPSTLPMSKYVTKIYLHGNTIDLLPSEAFANMPKLHSININHNKIKFVDENAFVRAENLKQLILKQNHFEEALPSNIFQSLASLKLLTLKYVTNLSKTHFQGLNNLKYLNLAFNGLNTIPNELFRNLRKLEHLYLTDNVISEVGDDAFEGLDHLVVLNLQNNSIRTLARNVFEPLKSLEFLRISHNKLEKVESGVFSQAHNLKVLHLDNNQIKTIESHAFEGLGHLEMLQLDNNNINKLSANVYENLASLKHLSVQGNKLTLDALQTIYEKYPKNPQEALPSFNLYHNVYSLSEDE